jgi:two-component system, OmpR family, response regulator
MTNSNQASGDTVLIVEDDEETRTLIHEYLVENGCKVRSVGDGEGMWEVLADWEPDVIIMDLMLPGDDGLTLCKKLSVINETAAIPVIMLTARGGETDRIIGLEMGADDYMPKPFSARELLARIKSVLRRSRAMPKESKPKEISQIKFSGWTFHLLAQQLSSPDGVIVELTKGESVLLQAFLQHPNEILDRDRIMEFYRMREATIFDRSIDVQIGR